jgi:ribose/xylose/arabinose/galactoside ABC-type transport system permease subunit
MFQLALYGVLVCLLGFFGFTTPYFFTTLNFTNILLQVSVLGMLAVGQTFVIVSAGIDLSVGSVVALTGCVAGYVAMRPTGLVAPIVAAVAVGAAVGFVNGFFVSYTRIPPFIVTLATLSAVRGVAYIITNTETLFGFNQSFLSLGSGSILGLPNLVWILIVVILVAYLVQRYTVFGRRVLAVGGNRAAAELFRVPVHRTELAIYMLSGAIAGLAGAALASRIAAGEPGIAIGYELLSIAPVIIGGTSLFGGEGGVERTIVGILILGVIDNGMNLMGIPSYYQLVLTAIVVVGAVLLDRVARRRMVG